MHNTTRRSFVVAGLAAIAGFKNAGAQSGTSRVNKPHVVVVGGGAGGATAARYLTIVSGGAVDVTLIEANKEYQPCFFSNHYIGGIRTRASMSYGYDNLRLESGVKVVHDRAIAVDRVARKVELSSGFVRYDMLILAPGIDFKEGSVQGWSLDRQHRMPHAYKGGEQVRVLRTQITSMRAGGVFAVIPPAGTYRCPPGPYERVCFAAHQLKALNPSAKIIILDPKPVFSKMGLFREAWKKHYKGMIEMNSDVDLSSLVVDTNAMTISIDGELIKVDCCNVIPAQKAGAIAHIAGVVDGDWAPVHAEDMRSKLDDNIYVLGDAAAQGDMPKSAYAANSQAKVCVSAILNKLTGKPLESPGYENTCWSWVAENDSVKIGATYKATADKISRTGGFVSKRRESVDLRRRTYEESLTWYSDITADMFGN